MRDTMSFLSMLFKKRVKANIKSLLLYNTRKEFCFSLSMQISNVEADSREIMTAVAVDSIMRTLPQWQVSRWPTDSHEGQMEGRSQRAAEGV